MTLLLATPIICLPLISLACNKKQMVICSEPVENSAETDSSHQNLKPETLFLSAYLDIEKAELSTNRTERINPYKSALSKYEQLKSNSPEWKIDIVDMRISDTRFQIDYTIKKSDKLIAPLRTAEQNETEGALSEAIKLHKLKEHRESQIPDSESKEDKLRREINSAPERIRYAN